MKALTLWRPWAWTFFWLEPPERKDLENRRWPLPQSMVDQTVAFHAGKHWDAEGAKFIMMTLGRVGLPAEAWHEGLIGTVRLVGCKTAAKDVAEHQRKWFIGPYAFECAEHRRLASPVPCKGAQGLWTVPEHLVREPEEG